MTKTKHGWEDKSLCPSCASWSKSPCGFCGFDRERSCPTCGSNLEVDAVARVARCRRAADGATDCGFELQLGPLSLKPDDRTRCPRCYRRTACASELCEYPENVQQSAAQPAGPAHHAACDPEIGLCVSSCSVNGPAAQQELF